MRVEIKKFFAAALFLSIFLLAGSAQAAGLRLDDTQWKVSYIGDDPVLPGTEITVNFGTGGTLYGSAGCNRYTTQYTAIGNKIIVDDIAVTRKACGSPKGIMEQENRFLDALQSAKLWRTRGGKIELMRANESLLLILYPLNSNVRPVLTRYTASGDKSALVEFLPDEKIRMKIYGKTYLMRRVKSASGEKYQAYENPKTIFWTKGDNAYITIDGKDLPEVFSAVGREPVRNREAAVTGVYTKGLFRVYVENIGNGKLKMTINGETFKMKRTAASNGARYVDEAGTDTVFWFYGNGATLTVKGRPYAMGEMLMLGEDTGGYSDPGSDQSDAPHPLTLGTWNVESIAGKKLIKGTRITMRFERDGDLKGLATINNYATSWLTSGERIATGRTSATKKGGKNNLVEQENRFLKALDAVRFYKIEGRTLTLIMKDGKKIIARY